VEKVDRKVTKYASAIPGFLGTGGMASKVRSAQKVALAGVATIMANGLRPHILKDIFAGTEVGTLFLPSAESLCTRKHWIAFTKSPKGEILIDPGAEKALVKRGKSLLPSGIKKVTGRFSLGDAVLLIGENGNEVAVGLVNYDSGDIIKIIGAKSSEIETILGFKHDDEVIHRDNLVLTAQSDEENNICQLRA
jgi:glutamate 5-kinase